MRFHRSITLLRCPKLYENEGHGNRVNLKQLVSDKTGLFSIDLVQQSRLKNQHLLELLHLLQYFKLCASQVPSTTLTFMQRITTQSVKLSSFTHSIAGIWQSNSNTALRQLCLKQQREVTRVGSACTDRMPGSTQSTMEPTTSG